MPFLPEPPVVDWCNSCGGDRSRPISDPEWDTIGGKEVRICHEGVPALG